FQLTPPLSHLSPSPTLFRYLLQCGQHQVAQRVTRPPVPVGEPVLQDLLQQGFRVRQSDEHIAHITGRGHLHIVAEATGTSPIVRHRHDGGDIDGGLLQPAQQNRQPRPSADRHDMRTAGFPPRVFFHPRHLIYASLSMSRCATRQLSLSLKTRERCSAMATERCFPPVHPIPTTSWVFPSR